MALSKPGERVTKLRWEHAFLLLFALLLVGIKWKMVRAMGVESDEPQHLHVVWGWTQGQVQYRDFFDNHTPLFHMLCAPLLRFLGERADILIPMRIAMLPLLGASLFCVYWLGARLYSPRVGAWAAIFTGFFPVFVDVTSQFRTDNLWLTAWLAAVAVALTSEMTRTRAFITGLLLGAAFSVSMKTSLLLASLVLAVVVVMGFRAWREGAQVVTRYWSHTLLAIAGMLVVPGVLLAYFASQNALEQMYYCVIQHNHVPGLGNWHKQPFRRYIFPVALPFILAAGYWAFRSSPDRGVGARRAIACLTALLFCALLESYWPLVTNQDFPPVIPLFCLGLTPLLFAFLEKISARSGSPTAFHKAFAVGVPIVIAAVELKMATRGGRLQKEETKPFNDRLAHMLRLTKPGDYVMDAKGATIFRQRPFYFALENITQNRMGAGSIKNTIVADMIRTHTCVATEERLPVKNTLRWVKEHYLPVANGVYVVGEWLKPQGAECTFDVVIPTDYAVVSSKGSVTSGVLDGAPFTGRAHLEPGKHRFQSDTPGPLAVIWAQAVETGSSPFYWWEE
jgi:hypothetical protein